MKHFFHLFFSVVLVLGILSTSNAEPQYKLEAKNFIVNSTTQWQFDIYLSRTGGGTEPYVKGQFVITYNSAILPGGGTLSTTYVAGSSGFTSSKPKYKLFKLCWWCTTVLYIHNGTIR